MSEFSSVVVPDAPAVHCPQDDVQITVLAPTGEIEVQPVDQLGTESVPRPIVKAGGVQKYLSNPSVTVITEQGGRGPIYNAGQNLTAGVLLGLLTDAIDEVEFTPELRARLDGMTADLSQALLDIAAINADLTDSSDIIDLINGQLESVVTQSHDPQGGHVTHDDTIILDFIWDKEPLVELTPAFGVKTKQIEDTTDPEVDYVEIPDQELVYGHAGLIETATPGQYQFTAKAALCKYVDVFVNNLMWTGADITANDISGLVQYSGACTLQNTDADCMGFRVEGYLRVRNSGATKVMGTCHLQMKIDGGNWVNIARFKKLFQATEVTELTKHFDILVAEDQASHTYQFRCALEVEDSAVANKELTASAHVSTVTESGRGTILTNNVLLKWTAKD